jgi:hypothetical protein
MRFGSGSGVLFTHDPERGVLLPRFRSFLMASGLQPENELLPLNTQDAFDDGTD